MTQEKIKKQIQEIYKLDSEPYWHIGCVKWAERTKEIFSKESGIKIEEAADKAAREVFSNYGKMRNVYIKDNAIETKSFTMMSIQTLLDEINRT